MRRLARLAVMLSLLPLAACLGSVDSEQVRVCRLVLPALNPEGTALREIGYAAAALGRQGVRIDYEAREPGEGPRRRYATCRGSSAIPRPTCAPRSSTSRPRWPSMA